MSQYEHEPEPDPPLPLPDPVGAPVHETPSPMYPALHAQRPFEQAAFVLQPEQDEDDPPAPPPPAALEEVSEIFWTWTASEATPSVSARAFMNPAAEKEALLYPCTVTCTVSTTFEVALPAKQSVSINTVTSSFFSSGNSLSRLTDGILNGSRIKRELRSSARVSVI